MLGEVVDKLRILDYLVSIGITWILGIIVILPLVFGFVVDGFVLTIGVGGFIVTMILDAIFTIKEQKKEELQ